MDHIVVGGLDAWLHYGERARTEARLFLVLIHGRTRSHADSDKMAKEICSAVPEAVCATFDLPNHGARLVDAGLNGSWSAGNAQHFTAMMAILDQGAAEAESLLRYVPHMRPELADCRRLVSGVSLGGHIVWKLVAELPDRDELLDGAFPIISTPDLPSLFINRYANSRPAIAESVALPPKLIAELKEKVVLRYDLHKTDFPITAVCGGNDQLVPPGATVAWSRTAPECQTVVVLEGVGHEVVPKTMELLVDFVKTYIVG